jgi:hypothetical protein
MAHLRPIAFGVLVLGLAACTTNPPTTGQEPINEKVALQVVGDPVPACQPGHKDALYNGTVFIKPGEVICVRLKVLGKSVVPESIVEQGGPTDTLIIRLWQETGGKATYLYIHNPLHEFLVYDASMLRPGATVFRHTSTCPVLSGRVAFEQWPYPISTLALTNFVTTPDTNQVACN